ncbi:hypothetical protein [Halobacterium wangiae]|uniref:hypothetical protein n=1 Tax=Halobacterium wangiae TaxID=2902623 RepID=UPI001E4D7BA8|nr:hypothetical protein [Halobacterium wangiae]
MSARFDRAKQYTKVSISVVGYGLLTLFMLLLTYLTYRYGGGFADWKSVVTILSLAMIAFITGWFAVTSWRDR